LKRKRSINIQFFNQTGKVATLDIKSFCRFGAIARGGFKGVCYECFAKRIASLWPATPKTDPVAVLGFG
jgi:hypothetical protein